MTAPTDLEMARARHHRAAPAPLPATTTQRAGCDVSSPARSAAPDIAPTLSLRTGRPAPKQAGRPLTVVAPTGIVRGRRSTVHTNRRPAALAFISTRHVHAPSQLGATPTGITSRRGSRETMVPAGNILTLPSRPRLRIIGTPRKDPHDMNTAHCLDIEVDDMDETSALFLTFALRDGTIDADERLLRDRLAAHRSNISGFSRRRTAAESYERNGPTRHTKSLFKEAGYGLVDLDRERRARRSNVVVFRARNESA